MASYPPPPPPPGYGPPPGQYGGYPPLRATNNKAVAALICGICSFVVCPLTAIAAVVLAPQAKREIAAEPNRYDGVGLAQAGQILGWVSIALMAIGAVLFVILIAIGIATSNDSSIESLAALAS